LVPLEDDGVDRGAFALGLGDGFGIIGSFNPNDSKRARLAAIFSNLFCSNSVKFDIWNERERKGNDDSQVEMDWIGELFAQSKPQEPTTSQIQGHLKRTD